MSQRQDPENQVVAGSSCDEQQSPLASLDKINIKSIVEKPVNKARGGAIGIDQ